MCTPYIESQEMVARAVSLSYSVLAISAFYWPTTQPPPLVAIVHTKPVITILVPKLVAMATTLRH